MIRFITNEDELVKLFPLFIAEGNEVGLDVTKLNPDKLWRTLEHCMGNGAVIVWEQDEKFVGAMVLIAAESYWSDDPGLTNLTNVLYYVLKDYRKSAVGLSLLKAARDYAKKCQLALRIQVESYDDLDRKDKFFKRYGFNKCGGNYLMSGGNYISRGDK